jgi:hypothetical protein
MGSRWEPRLLDRQARVWEHVQEMHHGRQLFGAEKSFPYGLVPYVLFPL